MSFDNLSEKRISHSFSNSTGSHPSFDGESLRGDIYRTRRKLSQRISTNLPSQYSDSESVPHRFTPRGCSLVDRDVRCSASNASYDSEGIKRAQHSRISPSLHHFQPVRSFSVAGPSEPLFDQDKRSTSLPWPNVFLPTVSPSADEESPLTRHSYLLGEQQHQHGISFLSKKTTAAADYRTHSGAVNTRNISHCETVNSSNLPYCGAVNSGSCAHPVAINTSNLTHPRTNNTISHHGAINSNLARGGGGGKGSICDFMNDIPISQEILMIATKTTLSPSGNTSTGNKQMSSSLLERQWPSPMIVNSNQYPNANQRRLGECSSAKRTSFHCLEIEKQGVFGVCDNDVIEGSSLQSESKKPVDEFEALLCEDDVGEAKSMDQSERRMVCDSLTTGSKQCRMFTEHKLRHRMKENHDNQKEASMIKSNQRVIDSRPVMSEDPLVRAVCADKVTELHRKTVSDNDQTSF